MSYSPKLGAEQLARSHSLDGIVHEGEDVEGEQLSLLRRVGGEPRASGLLAVVETCGDGPGCLPPVPSDPYLADHTSLFCRNLGVGWGAPHGQGSLGSGVIPILEHINIYF